MKKLVNIQIWRLFACAIVFIVHFGQRIQLTGIVRSVTDFGAYGVHLFFIISGFLIANSYFLYGHKSLKKFYGKKLANILPLYYIIVLYYFIVHTFVLKDVPADPTGYGWIRYIFVLNRILPLTGTYFWDNLGITWTIPYFVFSYLIIPLLLKYVQTFNSCLLLLMVSASFTLVPDLAGGWFSFLTEFPFFIIGALIWFAYKEDKMPLLSVMAAMGVILLIKTGLMSGYVSYVFGGIFALMIMSTMNIEIKSEKIRKILSLTDRYSYTFYLAHGVVFIHCLDKVVWPRPAEAVIAVVGSILLTVIVNRFAENPLKNSINKHLNKKEIEIVKNN